jgi:hypothetical protein
MVEIEIGVFNRQCLDRRIDDAKRLISEIAAWENQRKMPPATASNGCSRPTKPEQKWAAPILKHSKSQNHCETVLVSQSRRLLVAASPLFDELFM